MNYDQFDVFMRTNVAGPSTVTEELLPNIKASRQKKVIAISSSNGMITGKPLCCSLFWYRVSKAALNKPVVVANMIKVIDKLTIADMGHFLQQDGTPQPW